MAQKLTLFEDEESIQADAAELLTLAGCDLSSAVDVSDVGQTIDKSAVLRKGQSFHENTFASQDPSFPLANPREEKFLQYLLEGKPDYVAYQLSGHENCSRKTAYQQASRWKKDKRIAARLRFLMREKIQRDRGDEQHGEQPVSLAEMRTILSKAARTAINVSDRVSAIKQLRDIESAMTGGDIEAPDPAFLAEFHRIAREQGKTPDELAREMHGGDSRADAPHRAPEGLQGDVDEVLEDGGKRV